MASKSWQRMVLFVSLLVTLAWPVAAKNDSHHPGSDADHGLAHRIKALESAVAALQTANATQQTTIASLTTQLGAAQAKVTALESSVTGLAANPVLALAPYVSVRAETLNGLRGPHVIFEGVNVHVRSGSGNTSDGWLVDQTTIPTGRGNVIIGYNEPPPGDAEALRVGSHHLVLGTRNVYTTFAGIVGGDSNQIVGAYGCVLSGSFNSAGSGSAILGGFRNTTNVGTPQWFSHHCIAGGADNLVTGWAASVGGGQGNTASGVVSTVSGGLNNTASGWVSSVSGGQANTATGGLTSVSGGQDNTASGWASSVSGGRGRSAPADNNWAAGSLLETE